MKFLRSTLRDSATTVSLIDLTTEPNAGVIRGLEAGPGVTLKVVDADEHRHITKQKKVVIGLAGGPGGSGEVNTGINVGSGAQLFRDKTGANLNFRTLTAGGSVELTTVGNTILISAKSVTTLGQLTNDVNFITEASAVALLTTVGATQVEQTTLGAGEAIIITISGLGDIQHRTIVGTGAINVTSTPTEILISAAPNLTLLSELTNDVNFITEGSAQTLISNINQVSAVSQLTNDVNFITEGSANTAYVGVGSLTLLSQFTNDPGFITEASALSLLASAGATQVEQTTLGTGEAIITAISGLGDIQHRTIIGAGGINVTASLTEITISAAPNPTLLSELTNDVNFITETSAQTLISNINQVSAVSQLTNDAGYITETSALSLLASAGATQVEETTLGGGEAIIVSISGLGDIQHRTITVNGAIQMSASPTEIVLSASPNPTLLSELSNDVGYITEVSANSAYEGLGNLSALSQFVNDVTFITEGSAQTLINAINQVSAVSQLTNDIGYITEGSAQTLINAINQVSAVSQLTNDVDYITEGSANTTFVNIGDLSSLSQFNNDANFISEASALTLIASINQVSAVSQLTNDLGFVNQVSALGGGENIYIGTSATELQFKTVTGGGIVDVTTSGNTIKVSATSGGGGITIQEDSVTEGTPSTLNFVATQSNHNLGKAIEIDGSATSIATVNLYVPLQFSVRLNWTGTALTVGGEVSELPPGWTATVLSTTKIRINHNVGRFVRNFVWRGFQTTGTYYQFTTPTTGGTVRTVLGSETTAFEINITSFNGAGTVTSGHAYAEVSF